MPLVSLVVCLHEEAALLERLIHRSQGCFDDLVVVHDGPDTAGVREVAERAGGRLLEAPRSYQQEPHWPLAWQTAAHDWILRIDADEFPSDELREWLRRFRSAPDPGPEISGYTCIWPLWDGRRIVTKKWPAGRQFLFHRQRVRFFGMVEQVPVIDGRSEALPLILEHRPRRKSYGLTNLLLRRQAYHWRRVIAQSLLRKPTDLACWRWTDERWPPVWEEIRQRPLRTALFRLLVWPLRSLRDVWRAEGRPIPTAAICGGIHHCLIALEYWRLRRAGSRA